MKNVPNPTPPFTAALHQRFWTKAVFDDNGCLIWTGLTDARGYGRFRIGDKKHAAHRVAYELLVGLVPDGMELDHRCRTRRCINHHHLQPVTHRENVLRGHLGRFVRPKKTHCVHGHLYDPQNTRYYKGVIYCRTCKEIRQREKMSRQRAQSAASEGDGR